LLYPSTPFLSSLPSLIHQVRALPSELNRHYKDAIINSGQWEEKSDHPKLLARCLDGDEAALVGESNYLLFFFAFPIFVGRFFTGAEKGD
jgi:hypothetical protein